MNIDELLACVGAANLPENPNTTTPQIYQSNPITVSTQWTQGRTIYGGLSAALVSQAIANAVDSTRLLRTLNINFSGPLLADAPFEIKVFMLREGRTISQVVGQAIQNNVVSVQVTAIYAVGLDSSVDFANFSAPSLLATAESKDYPRKDHPVPGFINNIDMKLAQGDYPFSGSDATTMGGWMRYRETPNQITDQHLIGLIDAWPPLTILQLKELSQASTVNWQIQFIQPSPTIKADEYLGYLGQLRHSKDGIGFSDAQIWNAHGELVAQSSQTIIVYG